MCISNTTSCSSRENYGATKTWTLTTGNGTKTVYAQFKDAAGNVSVQYNDTIELDSTKPTANLTYTPAIGTRTSGNVVVTMQLDKAISATPTERTSN
jgi:hypothetical protein